MGLLAKIVKAINPVSRKNFRQINYYRLKIRVNQVIKDYRSDPLCGYYVLDCIRIWNADMESEYLPVKAKLNMTAEEIRNSLKNIALEVRAEVLKQR